MSKTLTFYCSGNTGAIDIKLNKIGNPNLINLSYNDQSGSEGWKNYLFDGKTGQTITLQNGGSVSFSGINLTFSIDRDNYYSFITLKDDNEDNDVKLFFINNSDILGLTNQDEVKHHYLFFSLFKDCKDIADASNLTMNSDDLMNYCYAYMFTNCTSLTATPLLPAMKLATACYLSMFEGCTSISATPLLPAKKLTTKCYEQMFEGCIELISAILPATDLASGCYQHMFYGCESLAEVTVKFSAWPGYNATEGWLTNVSPLGRFTKPTALTVLRSCGCTNKIPLNWLIENNDDDVDTTLNPTIITITQTYTAGEGITINNEVISLDTDWLSRLSWNWIIDYISENTTAERNHRYICQNENGLTLTLPSVNTTLEDSDKIRVSLFVLKLGYGKTVKIAYSSGDKIYIGGSIVQHNNLLLVEAPFCYIEFHYKKDGEDKGWHVINMSTPSSHRDYKAGNGLLSSGAGTITFSIDPNVIPNSTSQLTNDIGFMTSGVFLQLLDYEEFRNAIVNKLSQ